MTLWTPRRCEFPLVLRRHQPIRPQDKCGAPATTHLEATMHGMRVGLDVCERHRDQIEVDGGIETEIVDAPLPN